MLQPGSGAAPALADAYRMMPEPPLPYSNPMMHRV